MPNWPESQVPPWPLVSPWTLESLGAALSTAALGLPTSGVWPAANVTIYVPVVLFMRVNAVRLWVQNGGSVSGNFDLGIYDEEGTRIVSTGSTAMAGTSVVQTVDITDIGLGPGLFYIAMSCDNGTAAFGRGAVNAQYLRICGVFQEAVFTLPANATFATMAQAYLPNFGFSTRDTF